MFFMVFLNTNSNTNKFRIVPLEIENNFYKVDTLHHSFTCCLSHRRNVFVTQTNGAWLKLSVKNVCVAPRFTVPPTWSW